MPTTAPPCPQAARSPGAAPLPPLPELNNIVDLPVEPLPPAQQQALPQALVQQAITWPYHLPSFNGLDGFWWSLLARSMYAADSTWLRRVASWAGPVVRLGFVDRTQPARQAYGLVELTDSVLIVIPGTSSEAEALSYFVTHSLRQLYAQPDNHWSINATWAARGQQVLDAYVAWPPPTPRKPLIVIGHSSGGAYAAFVAYSTYAGPSNPVASVSYGAPIWGTPTLAAYYLDQGKEPKSIEFGLPNDLVTVLPPPWAVVDLLLLNYAQAARPAYERINPLLQFNGNNAPSGLNQAVTFDVVFNAARTLLTSGGIDAAHATRYYTNAANLWARSDPVIDAQSLQTAYSRLQTINDDMNAAGLY